MNQGFNPLRHDKILDQTKLKAFPDDNLNVTKMIFSVFDGVENIVGKGEGVENIAGKGEIACTSSYNVFKGLLSQTRQKVSLCGSGLT